MDAYKDRDENTNATNGCDIFEKYCGKNKRDRIKNYYINSAI
jgi:hypothetical protein